jgi:hypothetical protein
MVVKLCSHLKKISTTQFLVMTLLMINKIEAKFSTEKETYHILVKYILVLKILHI